MPHIPGRVVTVAPMPPEKSAYALARYSRSPDSIVDSVEWVRTHDSAKFLDSFYFQYGHASIADLGHLVVCFEGVSELAASEVEDEQLWDGQAKSSRYQDFGSSGFIIPPELGAAGEAAYLKAGEALLDAYKNIHEQSLEHLKEKLPRPDAMKPDAYLRNITARAFDVARYVLFWGIPTNVGQVTSIRTLERQVRRMKASEFGEVRELGQSLADACAAEPGCLWDKNGSREALAPTLAKYVDPDSHLIESQQALAQWASQNLPSGLGIEYGDVDLLKPVDTPADIVATLLYPVTDRPFRELYEWARCVSAAVREEVIGVALQSRTREELLRGFRGGLYCYDIVMDVGAYRDFHRHRRCQQYRQTYTGCLGYDTPAAITEAGLTGVYDAAMKAVWTAMSGLPQPAAQYLLPFGARSRFLFKMDFAEAEYISKLRSGVKGHFSYRNVAWRMKEEMEKVEPELGKLIKATPPWVEDPLVR